MNGKLYIVGIGPGARGYMTLNALEAIKRAQWLVGYKFYIDLLGDLSKGKKIYTTSMGGELKRANFAVQKVKEGYEVTVLSSGDPSLYGLASLCLEVLEDIDFEIIPGISAAFAASAKLGCPISEDLLIISLSDLLIPRELILKRIQAANYGDFVTALYNPQSRKRRDLLPYTVDSFLKARGDLPVGIVKNCAREGETIEITTLSRIDYEKIDMFTILIIGNSKTYVKSGKMITPRGYLQKYENL